MGGDLAVLIARLPSIIADESEVFPSTDVSYRSCLVLLGLEVGYADDHILAPIHESCFVILSTLSNRPQ
jgi:hypothetical protein